MTDGLDRVLALSDQDRRDVFIATAARLDTLPSYVEKDFWVCRVLDVLYNKRPDGHPQLLFKGGTALSKAFGLIARFSEDIDIVVDREGLGFDAQKDPTISGTLSNKRRKALFDELKAACSRYIHTDLADTLKLSLGEMCRVLADPGDRDRQTLLIEYPTLYPNTEIDYVAPRVKLEGGARSAIDPSTKASVTPYISADLADWPLTVTGIHVLAPERTYLEKLLILHGLHCGYRDENRLPADGDRISRHYYDVAMITGTQTGQAAVADAVLLDDVRKHNLIAFKQAWKRFEEATPGTIKLVPQAELRAVITKDYGAMQGMTLGKAPEFGWIMEQLQAAEEAINLGS